MRSRMNWGAVFVFCCFWVLVEVDGSSRHKSSTSSLANTASRSSRSRTTTTATPLFRSKSSIIRERTTPSTPLGPSTSYAPTTPIAHRAKSWPSRSAAPTLRQAPTFRLHRRRPWVTPARAICTPQALSCLLLWPCIFS